MELSRGVRLPRRGSVLRLRVQGAWTGHLAASALVAKWSGEGAITAVIQLD